MESPGPKPDAPPSLSTAKPEATSPPPKFSETATHPPSTTPPSKPIHSLVLDAGPLIRNDPPISTLLAQAEELYTIPSVISEIRDEAARSRVETSLCPFLKLRSPRAESVRFCTGFARKTGDLEVLSKPDLHLIALAYELEVERNHGDWRLRREPAQKGLNGRPPAREKEGCLGDDAQEQAGDSISTEADVVSASAEQSSATEEDAQQRVDDALSAEMDATETPADSSGMVEQRHDMQREGTAVSSDADRVAEDVQSLSLEASAEQPAARTYIPASDADPPEDVGSEDDDSDGWITPSNLHKHQAKDAGALTSPQPIQKILQAALLTSDYAMQNVLLRMNLNLVSPSLSRITHVKTWVLRCHGCYKITRDMGKQFCPSCGQATLTRVSCSTDAQGTFHVHLKRNFQFNKRGNVYSIPKPVHGSASGKAGTVAGGGKKGWGRELILAEDQKEYRRKVTDEQRAKYRDLMDEDYLPSILSGERGGGNGRIKVGAGRNVNSRKRTGR